MCTEYALDGIAICNYMQLRYRTLFLTICAENFTIIY